MGLQKRGKLVTDGTRELRQDTVRQVGAIETEGASDIWDCRQMGQRQMQLMKIQ
jgi:hypothetical protein